mmetsp:Transcript_74724/g.194367  ORF Transcript_74724/g.194367 Transcript_74724/m.194367 type:complete len:250 (-) Transcript_74724:424-1173(-)
MVRSSTIGVVVPGIRAQRRLPLAHLLLPAALTHCAVKRVRRQGSVLAPSVAGHGLVLWRAFDQHNGCAPFRHAPLPDFLGSLGQCFRGLPCILELRRLLARRSGDSVVLRVVDRCGCRSPWPLRVRGPAAQRRWPPLARQSAALGCRCCCGRGGLRGGRRRWRRAICTFAPGCCQAMRAWPHCRTRCSRARSSDGNDGDRNPESREHHLGCGAGLPRCGGVRLWPHRRLQIRRFCCTRHWQRGASNILV